MLLVIAVCIEDQLAHLKEKSSMQFSYKIFSCVEPLDGNFYICMTWANKNCIPCQAVYNKLELCEIPEEFRDFRRLEKVLVARKLFFKQIRIMPKCQSPKLKGASCNVPLDVVDICNILPRPADSNGIVITKLKRGSYNAEAMFILNQKDQTSFLDYCSI